VINQALRFNVLKCGRRWGKTKLSEELLLCTEDDQNGALAGFPVGYFAPTYKMLAETWRQVSEIVAPVIASKNEQEKRIELLGGGIIEMWSLDEPNTIRGRKYKRIVVDECEYVPNFKEAWEQVLRATLTDLIGDAWFLSTPKFGSTFFKTLAKKEDPKWATWTFTTYDNPHISKDEIDEVKDTLDEATFRCEFLAEDVSLAVNKFIYTYQPKIHTVKGLQAIPDLPIILSFDFNVEPIVALAGQVPSLDQVLILDEFRLLNSDIEELCARIWTKYGGRMLKVTGDASGQNRTALKRDLNYYKEIQRCLKLQISQFKIPPANPPIKNTRVLCNSLLQRHKNYHFSDRVPFLILDIEETEVDAHGNIDEAKDKHKGHLFAAWRYFNWTFLKQFLDLKFFKEAA
jgi:hypothetical protein